MAVPRMAGAVSEIMSVGASSTASINASPHAGRGGFVSITAIDGDLWATAGAAPVLAGQTREFAVLPADKIAVIAL